MLGSLLVSGRITSPTETTFLEKRLKALEARTQGGKRQPDSR